MYMDWHPADIIAALHKKGFTLAGLSREAGYADTTLTNAINRPWPRGEWIIADALGVHPSVIWPSRYFDKQMHLIDRKPKKPL